MPLFKDFGKDKVYFVTKEDHAIPSTVVVPPPEPQPGLITSTGEINWSCPCLDGVPTGPCGVEFREAFMCLHKSETDPKGIDCINVFQIMQNCFKQYPTVYKDTARDDDDDLVAAKTERLETEAGAAGDALTEAQPTSTTRENIK